MRGIDKLFRRLRPTSADEATAATRVEDGFAKAVPQVSRYIVTWAQNATPVNGAFLRALETYAAYWDAHIIVVPGRYRNPTSVFEYEDEEGDLHWDTRVLPYMMDGRVLLARGLTVHGDIKIQPTAKRPLSGFEVYGKTSSIFGHPKIQLRCVPTDTRIPRIFTSTGAVTVPNYTDSRAGKTGEGHHCYGAVVVEVDAARDLFHLRHVHGLDDGSFTDLDLRYDDAGVYPAEPAAALVCGDVHVAKSEPSVLDATLYAEDSLFACVQPEHVVYHDVHDHDSRNHHSRSDPFQRYARVRGWQGDSVEEELTASSDFLDRTPGSAQVVVVASNHHDAVTRWLREVDPRTDVANARIFHELWLRALQEVELSGRAPDGFRMFYEMRGRTRARFLERNEPFSLHGVSLQYHGDRGLGGARPGLNTYAYLSTKTITGHRHSPSIMDGNTTVGVTGALDQGYNDLPCAHVHAHCVLYADGKSTLIHVWETPDRAVWRLPPK